MPYQIKPTTYVQADGTTRNAMQTLTYGTAGNLRTYAKNYPNNTTWQINYTQNGMHTVYSIADPDGVTSYRCYNLDESAFYSESPIQNKFDHNYPSGPPCPSPSALISGATPPPYAAAYGYDADGDVATELHHHGCTNPNASPAPTPCPAISPASTKCNNVYPAGGTTCNFYDGLDRLVEVKLPYQANSIDVYQNPWITRYLYDLQGTQLSFMGKTFHAFGNLFTVQELLPSAGSLSAAVPIEHGSIVNATYVAIRGTAYDGLDRTEARYSTDGSNIYTENLVWDSTPVNGDDISGLLGQICNSMPSPQCENFDYFPDGEVSVAKSNDESSPERDYSYGPDGRVTQISQENFTYPQTYRYDVNGALQTSTDAGNMTSGQATLTHNRYPDGTEKSLDVASGALTQSGLFTYSYRNDGPLQTEQINDTNVSNIVNSGKTTLAYTYTDGGRITGRSESGVAALPSPQTTFLYQTGPPTGLVREQDTPVGNLTGFTYTAEGEVAQVISSGSPLCSFPSSTYTYTIRGELVNSPQCPGGAQTTPLQANGLALHVDNTAIGQTYTWNPVLAVITEVVGTTDSCDGGTDACVSLWGYDKAARLGQQQAPYPIVGMHQNNVPTYYSYDAENHLLSTQFVQPLPSPALFETTAWGPDGHPIKVGTYATASPEADERLHWNGNQLLFTTNQTSGLRQRPESCVTRAA